MVALKGLLLLLAGANLCFECSKRSLACSNSHVVFISEKWGIYCSALQIHFLLRFGGCSIVNFGPAYLSSLPSWSCYCCLSCSASVTSPALSRISEVVRVASLGCSLITLIRSLAWTLCVQWMWSEVRYAFLQEKCAFIFQIPHK